MQGKRILLGITGGIAAYKIAFLIRMLKKSGAEVRCIMTPASCDFISPLVVSTLSGNPVGIEFWNKQTGEWTNHVEYGLWADVLLIAPLTASTLAKMTIGNSDNLLLATYLSMKGPTIVAPAMDLDMYQHPSVKRNLLQLESDGVSVIPAESGELASGLEGDGRMAEPETIFTALSSFFQQTQSGRLIGKRILVTAGPTYEAIDPVRFIGNHSSGKMGFEIAKVLLAEGAEVVLVSGPTQQSLTHHRLEHVDVVSANEMFDAVKSHWESCSSGVFAAAVADYKPKVVASSKMKKSDVDPTIELIKNPDILAWAGQNKKSDQLVVGFALETEELLANGRLKLKKKNADFMVLNSLADDGAGFSVDTNKITILDAHNKQTEFELSSKREAAQNIVEYLIKSIQ
ncbi:MAG: bifunctional phosphopantothenoylcysteine decarboxylase/phosphopantothenate--cysteine ligase CoaBC [Cryomorphaceae bacterium]|nr:bifunctional phosphopantothenoylcysteine decarboxylase/phosphopantothenate--cysteine ligase CoaBC [Cryomorphaceae bacterium]